MIRIFKTNLIPKATAVVVLANLAAVLIAVSSTLIPQKALADEGNIAGVISYRDDVKLPEHAMLLVQVMDVTDASGATKIVDEETIKPNNQNPIFFSLNLSLKTLLPSHRYALQARIAVGDSLWFVSDKRVPIVNSQAQQSYTLHLVMVNQTNSAFSESTTELVGQKWRAQELNGEKLSGKSPITLLIKVKSNIADTDKEPNFDVSGSSGCNQYNSTVVIDRNSKTLRFEAPGMTFLACASDVDQRENAFITALMQARTYEFDDVGRLFFKDDQNHYSLIFVPDL